jgi:hypothetical protein
VSQARQHHNFDNVSKSECRQGNLRAALGNPLLYNARTKRLRGSWCELMGESGAHTLKLVESYLPDTGTAFVGVDRDKSVLSKFSSQYPKYTWLADDISSVVHELIQLDIAVLNLDGYWEVAAQDWEVTLNALLPVIDSGRQKFGSFLLICNNTLTSHRRGVQASEALLKQVEVLKDVLRMSPLTGELPELISKEDAEKVDHGFLGKLSPAFYVYRGEGKSTRMANMRISL